MKWLRNDWFKVWNEPRLYGPSRLALGFAGLIAAGSLLLRLPLSAAQGPLSWLDALFTATSAVCVTGLSTIQVGADLSRFGQVVLLILIQCGALGMTTFSTLLLVAAGRATVSQQMSTQDQWAAVRTRPLHLLMWVIGITVVVEILGALALTLEMGGERVAFDAAFHSISAFCNAGFSLYPDSLMGFHGRATIQVTVMLLIIFGGLGFIVLRQLIMVLADLPRRRARLFLHTRIVLGASIVLWVGGALLFACLEWNKSMAGLSWTQKLTASLFQSVTTRTAGFNTLDFGGMRELTLFFTMFLMWIGGAPGGVAGGIKVTTAVVILATVRARLRASEQVWLFQRTVPREIVQRAFQLAVLSLLFLAVVMSILLYTEEKLPPLAGRRDHFLMLAFESVSAFATVGLSTGITPDLSGAGKLVLSIAMYVGRLGPLVFALAVFRPRKAPAFEYPHEPVAIG